MFYDVSKSVYPYHTLHTEGCSFLARTRFAKILTDDEAGRLDSIRLDYCSRCMKADSPARMAFYALQRERREVEKVSNHRARLAREIAALRAALAEAEADPAYSDEETQRLLTEYSTTGADGSYRLPTVEIGR